MPTHCSRHRITGLLGYVATLTYVSTNDQWALKRLSFQVLAACFL